MERNVLEAKDIVLDVENCDRNMHVEYVRLLRGLSFKVYSGRLTAVMGASGSGKTSLFNTLIGNVDDKSKSYGCVTYNGEERTEKSWYSNVAYLEQDDIFIKDQTVYEFISYTARFRNPTYKPKEIDMMVKDSINIACIMDKMHAKIGSLSGGERKRAMIANTFVFDPKVVLLDEPTTGLDSHTALVFINSLKMYAEEKNKIVLLTVHQPGEGLFSMFEDILYLGKGGTMFYSGSCKDMSKWLEDNQLHKPDGLSLAEFVFELHSKNPYLPSIANFKPRVEELITLNNTEYQDYKDKIYTAKYINKNYSFGNVNFRHVYILIERFIKLSFQKPRSVFWFLFFSGSWMLINFIFLKLSLLIFRDYSYMGEDAYVVMGLGASIYSRCFPLFITVVFFFIIVFNKTFYLIERVTEKELFSSQYSISSLTAAGLIHDFIYYLFFIIFQVFFLLLCEAKIHFITSVVCDIIFLSFTISVTLNFIRVCFSNKFIQALWLLIIIPIYLWSFLFLYRFMKYLYSESTGVIKYLILFVYLFLLFVSPYFCGILIFSRWKIFQQTILEAPYYNENYFGDRIRNLIDEDVEIKMGFRCILLVLAHGKTKLHTGYKIYQGVLLLIYLFSCCISFFSTNIILIRKLSLSHRLKLTDQDCISASRTMYMFDY